MGVARQLQIEASHLGCRGTAGLVSQQYLHRGGRRPGQCGLGVAAVGFVEVAGAVAGTPASTSSAAPRSITTCSLCSTLIWTGEAKRPRPHSRGTRGCP